MNVLAETVRDWPQDGFAVLDADGGQHPGIIHAVIRGWAVATVDDDTAALFLDRLSQLILAAVAGDLTQLLAGGRSEAPTEWHRIPAARLLAAKIWAAIPSHPPASGTEGWLAHAINHPAGRLAEFWVHAVAADWRAGGDSWQSLPPAIREQLETVLAGADDCAAMAEIIFAGQLQFFHGADLGWCLGRALPLLDWADPVRARRTWDGFLSWGRWNDQLLAAGLTTQYLAGALHIGDFPEELQRQLTLHLATIALHSQRDPIADGWIPTFTATTSAAVRAQWMNQVSWQLRGLPAEALEHQWRRWMRMYWRVRLASVPVQLADAEASAMAAWAVYLTSSVDDGVALATAHHAGLTKHSHQLPRAHKRADRTSANGD